jgi:hypothetical protein
MLNRFCYYVLQTGIACSVLMFFQIIANTNDIKAEDTPLYNQEYITAMEQFSNESETDSLVCRLAEWAEITNQEKYMEEAVIWWPTSGCVISLCALSGCVGSGCQGSGCVGSVCVATGCAGSVCVGSVCVGSGCVGSVCTGSGCVGSACGGSGCGGSICAGSACTGSACVGSVCLGSVCLGSGCLGTMCTGSACINSECIASACGVSVCVGSVCGASACITTNCGLSACYESVCTTSGCSASGCSKSACVYSGCVVPGCAGGYHNYSIQEQILLASISNQILQIAVPSAGKYTIVYKDNTGCEKRYNVTLKSNKVNTLNLHDIQKLLSVQVSNVS